MTNDLKNFLEGEKEDYWENTIIGRFLELWDDKDKQTPGYYLDFLKSEIQAAEERGYERGKKDVLSNIDQKE